MDVFDEGICDDVLPEDWAKVERARRTNGFKEGMAAGQEATLQEGFNRGFSEGVLAKFSSSFVKGIIQAMIARLRLEDEEMKEGDDDDGDAAGRNQATIADLEVILTDLDSLRLSKKKSCDPGRGKDSRLAGMQPSTSAAEGKGQCPCAEEDTPSSSHHTKPVSFTSGYCKSGSDATSNETQHTRKEQTGAFYAQNEEFQKIVERLTPHLARLQCDDVLCMPHPFLNFSLKPVHRDHLLTFLSPSSGPSAQV